jgi:hypothetical protein
LSAAARPQENFVSFIERVMRVMTHFNIGVAIGLVAWVLWSGWQVVTGQIAASYRVAEVETMMSVAHAGQPVRLHLMPMQAGTVGPPPCHSAVAAPKPAALVLTGADL